MKGDWKMENVRKMKFMEREKSKKASKVSTDTAMPKTTDINVEYIVFRLIAINSGTMDAN